MGGGIEEWIMLFKEIVVISHHPIIIITNSAARSAIVVVVIYVVVNDVVVNVVDDVVIVVDDVVIIFNCVAVSIVKGYVFIIVKWELCDVVFEAIVDVVIIDFCVQSYGVVKIGRCYFV